MARNLKERQVEIWVWKYNREEFKNQEDKLHFEIKDDETMHRIEFILSCGQYTHTYILSYELYYNWPRTAILGMKRLLKQFVKDVIEQPNNPVIWNHKYE